MITSVVPKLPFINKQQTIDFYVRHLGFTLLSDYGDYLIMKYEGAELHFFAYPELQPGKSDFMIYVRVDSGIDDLFATYSRSEAPFRRLGPMEEKPWGQKEFPLIDPNGTLLTFGQPTP